MKVAIGADLNEYMHKHHHDTVMLSLIHDSYGPLNIYSKHPRIRYHEPKHLEAYDKYIVNDITVYVSKKVKAYNDQLMFVDEKLFGIHRCHVKGLNLDYTDKILHH